MPEKVTRERAQRDKREGKAASTQAGEYVREEIHHIREGKHGARSAKQAVAIGLSKARRDGVKLPAPGRRSAGGGKPVAKRTTPSPKRARATREALEREPRSAASHEALSRHARAAARQKPGGGQRRNVAQGRKKRPGAGES